jgi:Zn-dependent peptidase ImmA (M78 family)/DNA-binding XRE family transcriptional regulator
MKKGGKMQAVLDRIRELRQKKGFTQAQLGKHILLSRDSILRIEKGTQPLSLEILEKIAAVLEVTVEALISGVPAESEKEEEFHYLLRSESNAAFIDQPEIKNEFESRYHRFTRLQDKLDDQNYTVELPVIPQHEEETAAIKAEAEETAIKVRRLWDLGQDPIDDIVQFLENLGFIVMAKDMGDTTRDHTLFAVSGSPRHHFRPAILLNINDKISYERKRFSLAHELAHWIAHREKFTDLPPGGGRGRRRDPNEIYADAFAGAFLVPADGLRHAIRQFRKTKSASQSIILHLKHFYKVSYLVIIIRLMAIGYLDTRLGNRMLGKGKKNYPFKEPEGLEDNMQFNQELNLLAQALESDAISEEQVLELHFTHHDIASARKRINWLNKDIF